jgi:hypothetical protein
LADTLLAQVTAPSSAEVDEAWKAPLADRAPDTTAALVTLKLFADTLLAHVSASAMDAEELNSAGPSSCDTPNTCSEPALTCPETLLLEAFTALAVTLFTVKSLFAMSNPLTSVNVFAETSPPVLTVIEFMFKGSSPLDTMVFVWSEYSTLTFPLSFHKSGNGSLFVH